ncbi:MAG: phytoene desaturase family protein [Sporichthyaceae bacterium]
MARVVVIGAGMSGLAAAARLARLRHEVTVLEQADSPGGRCGRYERDGFAFDTGPGLLHLPATYRDLFTKTGKTAPLESVLSLAPLDPAASWQFADCATLDVPASTRAGMTDALSAAFGGGDAAGWDGFIAEAGEIWGGFRWGFNAAPNHRLRDALRSKEGRTRLKTLTPHRSLHAMAKAHLHDPRLRQVIDSYPLRLGADPRESAAMVSIWPHLAQTFGTWRPRGGVAALVDAMAARARLRGASLRFDTAARAITIEGASVRGVEIADGSSIEADHVVAACGEHARRALLGHDRRSSRRERGGAAAVTLLLALDGAPALPAPPVSVSPDPDVELPATCGPRPHAPPPPTRWTDTAIAPEGAAAWQVQATVPAHGPDGVEWTAGHGDAYARHLLDILDRRGYEVCARLRWHEMRTPADLAARTGRPGGSLLAHAGALSGRTPAFAPPNRTRQTTGLWCVGSDVHPGPGIDLAPLGAALVAGAIGRAR